MKDRRRNGYPEHVAVYIDERRFARHYWLEITKFKGRERVKRGFRDLAGKEIEMRLAFHPALHVDAHLIAGKNEITMTSEGVTEVTIHLHPEMVDFSKPVTVRANGKRRSFRIKPSLKTLLESARYDRGLLYTASIKVSVR